MLLKYFVFSKEKGILMENIKRQIYETFRINFDQFYIIEK